VFRQPASDMEPRLRGIKMRVHVRLTLSKEIQIMFRSTQSASSRANSNPAAELLTRTKTEMNTLLLLGLFPRAPQPVCLAK